MVKKTVLLLLGLLVVLGVLFLLPDFHLLRGEMAVNSSASTSSYKQPDAPPTLPRNQTVDLYVQAPPRLGEDLTQRLVQELSANPFVGEVRVQRGAPATTTDSVLVVRVRDGATLFWSPFYTNTDLTAEVWYASDGQVDWIDAETVAFENTDDSPPRAVRMHATHEFQGSAYGLVSRPGQASYLAAKIASQIDTSLAETLTNQEGT